MATQTVTVSRAPSNGAAHSTGTPAASAAIDYSLTDLDLLEAPDAATEAAIDAPAGAPADAEPEPGKGTEAGDEAAADKHSPAASAEQPVSPAEFSAAFELPGIGPKLREICERDSAYREVFPTVADARAVREIFATPDAARAAATAQADLARLDRMVESRDPRAHAELLKGLQRLSPQAFRELAFTFAEQLAALDPEAHQQVSAAMAGQSRPAGWREHAALLSRAVEQQDWPAVKFLAATLTSNLTEARATPSSLGASRSGGTVPLVAPSAPRPSVPTNSTNGPAHETGATVTNDFLATINAGVEQAVHASVASKVGELLPDASEGARQKISGEIFRELDRTLRQDPELLEQVREWVSAALRAGGQHAAQPGVAAPHGAAGRVAQLIAGRARAALPAVAKRVVADWSETVLRSSQTRRSRQSESASRVEVGRGGAPGPVPLRPRGVDYNRMSDSEILDMD